MLSLYIGTFILSSPLDSSASFSMCTALTSMVARRVPLNSLLSVVSFFRPLMLGEIHLQRWMTYKARLSPLNLVIPCTLLRDICVGSFRFWMHSGS